MIENVACDIAQNLGPFTMKLIREENYSGEHREWHEEIIIPRGAGIVREITKAVIGAMTVQSEPVAWHSPLGGLIEARQIAQQAYKDIEREKSINGHIAGNPYDVALSALNSVLGCLAVLVDLPHPAEWRQ